MPKSKEILKVHDAVFDEIIKIIENAKQKAYSAVNKEIITMYWNIGQFVSERVKSGKWGDSIINELSAYIKHKNPYVSGFSPQNLRRMRQFYETYANDKICSPLVSKISWTNNILIMSKETQEARQFYLILASKSNYSKRELERQIDSSLYERTMLSKNFNVNKLLAEKYDGVTALRDNYILEFMDIPKDYKEKDLRKAIVANLKDFLLEFGRDFSFVGEEFRVQVGDTDFYIDLVFFNRELNCLVAIELKNEKFKPEHIGQLQFYLEALDRDVKKPNENASVGLLLCADKNDAVVEYAMSRSLSPNMIAKYSFVLPDKKLLEQRVKEITQIEVNKKLLK